MTSRRPPTAVQLALTIVTAGLAIACVALALVAPAEASPHVVSWQEVGGVGPGGSAPTEVAYPSETANQVRGDGTVASSTSNEEEELTRAGLPGVVRAGPPAISRDKPPSVYPAAEPFTPGGLFRPSARVGPPGPGMPLPVTGDWWVTCGYRCGWHTPERLSTFALDIVRVGGKTAGQTVRSPVNGRVVFVVESSVAFCNGGEIRGPEAGAAMIIDFNSPDGAAHRLRLVHLNPATIPKTLRVTRTPVPVKAGAYLGSLAPIQGCEHLHFNMTRLEQGLEIPEPMVIEGTPLKDCGGLGCWEGAVLSSRGR